MVVSIIVWSGLLSFIYFSLFKYFKIIRLKETDELIGGDIFYFAPIKMAGTISSYTKGLELSRLNSEIMNLSPSKLRPRSN